MPVVQSTYSENLEAAVAGLLASMGPHNIDTRIAELTQGIPFGRACGQGTNDKGCRLGAAAGAEFVGVSVRDVTLDPTFFDTDYVDEYRQYQNVGLLTMGDIWIEVGAAVNAGDDVTFAAATGILSSAGTGGSQFAIAGARWMTSAATNGLAKLRLSGELPSA